MRATLKHIKEELQKKDTTTKFIGMTMEELVKNINEETKYKVELVLSGYDINYFLINGRKYETTWLGNDIAGKYLKEIK